MGTYQYKHGDRPLEGYTIQRAIGKGGFGEVYYAVGDGGRYVALKAIQGWQEIELRGVGACMNLKCPHLVTIFDVKYNDSGRAFVIMEYISGPSLRDILDKWPNGLGAAKAAFFLREIGKGLSFLHESGIVHRDLKPDNVFFEDGYVKIGDYGLAKVVSGASPISQTADIGTPQYMAPEICKGKYGQGVDIYALGVVLYEMMTGGVPFDGSNKARPNMTGIEEPFRRTIRKALAKDPEKRYRSVQEMVEAVFETEHIRNSVSQFAADDLSAIAKRIAKKIRPGASKPRRAERVRGTASERKPRVTRTPAPPTGRNLMVADLGVEMVHIEPGSFQMGSNSGDHDETPVHTVRISRPFWMGKTEVTQAQYQAIAGTNPSVFKGADLPVENVSWSGAVAFCEKLTERERQAGRLPAGHVYRLPTEAEWEYAARGGIKSRGFEYAGSANLDEVAWNGANSGSKTHPVGRKRPNELGLYDMSGNVWEWCHDGYDANYYANSPSSDPTGPSSAGLRVLRGGSWSSIPWRCRATYRDRRPPDIRSHNLGFRVVGSWPLHFHLWARSRMVHGSSACGLESPGFAPVSRAPAARRPNHRFTAGQGR